MDSFALTPIEQFVRDEALPDDAILIVRAGPLTVEKLRDHALREQERYSHGGVPLSSISVDATVEGWTVEAILRDRLWSRSTYALSTAGALRTAGHGLLPTFEVPHYEVVLPAATAEAASSLLALFGPVSQNPYRRRR